MKKFAGLALLCAVLGSFRGGHAAEFFCSSGDVTCLIASINQANQERDQDTIFLEARSYVLTSVDNDTNGPNGLPSITSNITIQGAGTWRLTAGIVYNS